MTLDPKEIIPTSAELVGCCEKSVTAAMRVLLPLFTQASQIGEIRRLVDCLAERLPLLLRCPSQCQER